MLGKTAGKRSGSRHEAGGVVGPRRQKKRLMGLDSHTHRRQTTTIVAQAARAEQDMTNDFGDSEPRPWERPGAVRRDRVPHRSGWLLLLGLAALACGLIAVLANLWITPRIPLAATVLSATVAGWTLGGVAW